MGCKHSKNPVAQEPPPTATPGRPPKSAKKEKLGMDVDFLSNHIAGTDITKDYVVTDLLGKGSFGSVYFGVHTRTSEQVAVKVMDRTRIKSTSIDREWTVLEHLGKHENVVEYKGAYATAKEVSFVLELMNGGELFDRLIRSGAYSEAEAREPFRQVASALDYLHKRGIIHRDLKPENLLLVDETLTSDVKIADFGLSQLIKPNQKLTKVCGTWAYAAPEMSDSKAGGYDCRFDTWGYGVILFVVLCGYHPFDPEGGLPVPEIKARARAAFFDFDQPEWAPVSDLAKDLLRKLIVKNPEERLTAEQILLHPWFTQDVPSAPINMDIGSKISSFQVNYRRKLKASIYGSFFIASLRTMSMNSMVQKDSEGKTGEDSGSVGSGRRRGSSGGGSGSGIVPAAHGPMSSHLTPGPVFPPAKRLLVEADRRRGSTGSPRTSTPLGKRLPTIRSTSRVELETGSSEQADPSPSRPQARGAPSLRVEPVLDGVREVKEESSYSPAHSLVQDMWKDVPGTDPDERPEHNPSPPPASAGPTATPPRVDSVLSARNVSLREMGDSVP